MQPLKTLGVMLLAMLLVGAAASTVTAQERHSTASQVTSNDIQRLQDAVYDASVDIGRLRSTDAARADEFQGRLDDLRDELIYLKVKLRKEGVSRSEYTAVRNGIDDLRSEVGNALPASARTRDNDSYANPPMTRTDRTQPPPSGAAGRMPVEPASTAPPRQGSTSRPNEIPADTELDVRLEKALSSDTAQVEDQFTATTVADLYNGNKLMVPAGSTVRGVVTAVTKAGRIERTGKLTLGFDRVTINGRSYPMHATVTQALQAGGYRQDAGKIGAGAGVGAILGGILGGLKGALAGILIGGGGVVAATEGQDVNLPAGTVLRIRLDSPLTIR